MGMNPTVLGCQYCQHPEHEGRKCGAPVPCGDPQLGKVKPCKCKSKPGFWRGMLEGLGNAIGEAKFGGE